MGNNMIYVDKRGFGCVVAERLRALGFPVIEFVPPAQCGPGPWSGSEGTQGHQVQARSRQGSRDGTQVECLVRTLQEIESVLSQCEAAVVQYRTESAELDLSPGSIHTKDAPTDVISAQPDGTLKRRHAIFDSEFDNEICDND
jgi:hypothetical protein